MAHAHEAAFAPDESDLVEADVAEDARTDAIVHPLTRAARRPCARPACPAPARATLRFAYEQREAHIEALADAVDPQAYDLCVTHADRTRPPHGWQLRDGRSDEDRQPDTPPAKPTDLGSERTVAVLAAALRAVPTSVPENGRGQPQVTEIASEGAGVHPADGGSPVRPATAAVRLDVDATPNHAGVSQHDAGAPRHDASSLRDDADAVSNDAVAMKELFVVPDIAAGPSEVAAVRGTAADDSLDFSAPPIDDDPAWLDSPDGEWDDYDRTLPASTPSDAGMTHVDDVWSAPTAVAGGAERAVTGCGEAGCADATSATIGHDASQHRASASDAFNRAAPVSREAAAMGSTASESLGIDAPTLFAAETSQTSAIRESTMDTVVETSPPSVRSGLPASGAPGAPGASEQPDVRIVRVTASDDATALPGGPGFATSW